MLGTRTAGLPDCRPLLADPEDLSLVFQPIVDLAAATVAGYEALARFPGVAGPDAWFAAAAEAGIAAELEALAIHKALAAVPSLPPNTFLTVNVSPHLLGAAPVQHALATRPDLHRVVVELTEHTRCTTWPHCAGRPTSCAAAAPSSPWTTQAAATPACSSWPPCDLRSSSWTGRWSATPTPIRCGWRWPRCSASSPAGSTPGCSPKAWRPRRSWPRSCGSASPWARAGCSAGPARTSARCPPR